MEPNPRRRLLRPLLTSPAVDHVDVTLSGTREISPGKNAILHRTTVGFTSTSFGHESFAVIGPLALLVVASHPLLVHRPAVALPASFTPSSRSDALRFASLAVTSSREDFHLQDRAHAGRTKQKGDPQAALFL
jgi:hypothetical protein